MILGHDLIVLIDIYVLSAHANLIDHLVKTSISL